MTVTSGGPDGGGGGAGEGHEGPEARDAFFMDESRLFGPPDPAVFAPPPPGEGLACSDSVCHQKTAGPPDGRGTVFP